MGFMSTILPVPHDIMEKHGIIGRQRIQGIMNGAEFNLAIQRTKEGLFYLSVSAALRRAMKVREGDMVEVRFRLADPEHIDLPEELVEVIAQDPLFEKAWNKLTTGRKRGIAHYVGSVKSTDSRIRRAFEIMEKASSGRLHGQSTDK